MSQTTNDNKWLVYKSIDSYGNDLIYMPGKSIEEMKNICLADTKYIGFNTLGYFKSIIQPSSKWVKQGEIVKKLSMYIHKDRYEKYLRSIGVDYKKEIQILSNFSTLDNSVLLIHDTINRRDIINSCHLKPTSVNRIKVDLKGYGFKNGSMICQKDTWIFVGDRSNVITNDKGSKIIKGNSIDFTPYIVVTDIEYNILVNHELLNYELLDFNRIEDSRIFRIKTELWVIMSYRNNNNIVSMLTGKLNMETYKIDKLYSFEGDFPKNKWQKNWSPYTDTDEFKVVYSINPWKSYIVRLENDVLQLELCEKLKTTFNTFVMGGTPYIKWKDGWLSVGHEQTWVHGDNKHRSYANRFIYKTETTVQKSKLFHLITRTMEFPTSIHNIGNSKVLISLGVQDSSTYVVEVDMTNISFC